MDRSSRREVECRTSAMRPGYGYRNIYMLNVLCHAGNKYISTPATSWIKYEFPIQNGGHIVATCILGYLSGTDGRPESDRSVSDGIVVLSLLSPTGSLGEYQLGARGHSDRPYTGIEPLACKQNQPALAKKCTEKSRGHWGPWGMKGRKHPYTASITIPGCTRRCHLFEIRTNSQVYRGKAPFCLVVQNNHTWVIPVCTKWCQFAPRDGSHSHLLRCKC